MADEIAKGLRFPGIRKPRGRLLECSAIDLVDLQAGIRLALSKVFIVGLSHKSALQLTGFFCCLGDGSTSRCADTTQGHFGHEKGIALQLSLRTADIRADIGVIWSGGFML